MSSFAELRAAQAETLEKLLNQSNKAKGTSNRPPDMEDETFYDATHVRGKEGTGFVRGRLLSAIPGEDENFVHWFEYQFQGPGGWYIQRSRQSLGSNEKDPVYEYNGAIFADKSLTKDQIKKKLLGRRSFYVVQWQVIKDPNKPENEGKIFKWKVGPQIFNVIDNAMKGELIDPSSDEGAKIPAFNPFNPVIGRDFIFRVTTKMIEGKEVPSYETSSFAKEPSSLVDSEEEFNELVTRQYSLKEVNDDKHYKSYETLKRIFDKAMGLEAKSFLDTDEPIERDEPVKKQTKAAKPASEELNDSIPGLEDDKPEPKATEFEKTDDDDWFNQLKK